MTKVNPIRVGLSALAVAMIAGLVVSAAPTPAYAGCGALVNCNELFCKLHACEVTYAGIPPSMAICKNIVYQEYFNSHTTDFNINACIPGSWCAYDGRANQNCSAPELAYCDEDTVDFWSLNYFTGEGEFDFSVPTADLQKSVNEKTLVAQNGAVKVYLMPNNIVLLLAPQSDGKTYFMEFNPNVCLALREGAEWGIQ